jgi:hypothetical protein
MLQNEMSDILFTTASMHSISMEDRVYIAIETTDSPAGDFHKLVGHVGILGNAYLQTIKGAALLLWHKNVVLILLDLPVYKRTKNPGFFIIIH